MRKAIFIIALALAGCAAQPSTEVAELRRYSAEVRPLAGTTVKWSAYYEGLYARLLAAGAAADQLELANNAIRYAKEFEAGTLSAEEFDDRRRTLQIRQARMDGIIAERDRVARLQAQSAGAAQVAAAAQLIQAGSPTPLAPAPVGASQIGLTRGVLQNQSVSGSLRYCRYSNGVVITLRTAEVCPPATQ